MSSISAGEAYVAITCDDSALVRGLQEVAAKIDETSRIVAAKETNLTPKLEIDAKPAVDALRDIRDAVKETKEEGKNLSAVFAVTASDVVNFFKGAALASAKALGGVGDQFDKMSQRVGVSTDALSEYGHAATMCGADISNIEGALRSMATLTLNASNGMTKATSTFKRLGIEFESFKRMTPEQQFDLLASKIATIEDPTTRAAEAMKVFGGDGQKLLPLFASGADGLAQMREEARALGVSIDPVAAKMGADFTDATTRLKESLKGVGLSIGAALAPALVELFNGVAKVVSSITQWARENPIVTQTVVAVTTAIVGWIAAVQAAKIASAQWSAAVVKLKDAMKTLQALTGATTTFGALSCVAFAAVAAAVIAYVVKLKQAADEASKSVTVAQDALAKGNSERTRDKSEMDELEELRRKQARQKLSNEELARAAEIVAGLKSKYGDVGYEVDVVNGKIKAAKGAQDALNRAMLQQKAKDMRKAIAEKEDNIHSGKLLRDMADEEVSASELALGKQRGTGKFSYFSGDEINPDGSKWGLQNDRDVKAWIVKNDSEFKKKYNEKRKENEDEIKRQKAELKALEEALKNTESSGDLSNITAADLEEGTNATADFISKGTLEIKASVQAQCDAIDEERDKLIGHLKGLVDPASELDWNDAEGLRALAATDENAKKLIDQISAVERSAANQKQDIRDAANAEQLKAEQEAQKKLAQIEGAYNTPEQVADRKIKEAREKAEKERKALEDARDAAPKRERKDYDEKIADLNEKERREIEKIREQMHNDRANAAAQKEIDRIQEQTDEYKKQLQALLDLEKAKGDAKDEGTIKKLQDQMTAADARAEEYIKSAREKAQQDEEKKKEDENQKLQSAIDKMVDKFGSPIERIELAERGLQSAFAELENANNDGDKERIAAALERLGEAQVKFLDAQDAAKSLDSAVKSLGGTFDAWQAMSMTQQISLEKKAYDEARAQTRYLAQIARNIGTAKFA